MKYIMFRRQVGDMQQDIPVMFPNTLNHSEVAEALKNAVRVNGGPDPVVVGAGEVILAGATCVGSSESLGVKSRGRVDARIIDYGEYTGGWVV